MASRHARLWMAEQLGRVGLDEELVEAIVLAASELVTNVVVHTDSEPSLSLTVEDGRVCVGVTDSSPTAPEIREVEDGRVGGWGLRIVDDIAHAWGVEPAADGSKVVWFSVPA